MASRTSTDPIEILIDLGMDLGDFSDQDYLGALMEAIATIEFQTKGKGDARSVALRKEVAKVRKSRRERKNIDPKQKLENPETIWSNIKYGGPQARKTKISAGAFKKGSATGTNLKPKALPTSALVLYQAPEAAAEEEGGEKKKRKRKPKEKNLLKEIAKSVTNIADTLKKQYDLKKKFTEEERRRAEQQKRKLQEAGLEKRFEGILKTAQKIIAPIRSIFDRIIQFLTMVFLGKFLSKLVDWFTNPENQSKVKSIIRFLSDNWPKLLSAYIIFGTGLGKFSRFLVKVLARGAVRLAAATAGLLARLFGGRALGRFSRFLGKRGKLIAGGVEAVTTIFAFKALENAFTKNLGPEESASIDNDIPVSGYQGGGLVQPIFKFQGGGPVKFNLLDPRTWMSGRGQQAVGSKGTGTYSDDTLGGRLLNRRNATNEAIMKMRGYEEGGEVDGQAGIDKVPAMLTDGEFVMSRGAVQKYGLAQLEAMNAAGGGTNRPKMMNGTVFAAGGGHVGDRESAPDKMLTPVEKNGTEFGAFPASGNFGYRLGQINPETFVTSITKIVEETIEKTDRRRGQGGRPLGDTTRRGGEGFRITESADGFTTTQIDRIVKGGRLFQDKTTLTEITAAIGRPDLIEHQDQILKQLPKGTTIQDVMSGAAIPGVTTEQLARILATSDAQKATDLKEKRARRLDEAIRGIDPDNPGGYSMSAGDMTPALRQAEATANKRHAELMKSTDPEKIAAYDKKHGQGAYSQKLKEKLYRTYGAGAGQTQPTVSKPTGQVVGRENLSPQAQAAIARLEAKKGLPPDMQYTRNGRKISADDFNRTKNMVGAAKEGGAKGVLDHMISGAKNMFGGMFGGLQGAVNDPRSFVESMGGTVRDGNKLPPTAEEQRYIDEDKAGRAKIDAKYKARDEERSKAASKQAEHDRLFGEYRKIVMNEDHPLHRKVAGDLFTDDEGMKFADFKKFKAQQSQAKLSPNQPQPKVTAPQPPTPPSNNVQVIKSPTKKQTRATESGSTGGSNTPNINAGNGDSSKFKIYGFSPPR